MRTVVFTLIGLLLINLCSAVSLPIVQDNTFHYIAAPQDNTTHTIMMGGYRVYNP